ncbi:MAG: polysaccharide deacetylase family protein [Tissierellia bacterium]|nr:polysaccharide deacetylase family protein [Tissierellia bacterium]
MFVKYFFILLSIYLIYGPITALWIRKNHRGDVPGDYRLSFDDGPTEITEELLDLLEKYEEKAYFFPLGKKVKGNEDIIRRIEKEHDLGFHGYAHINYLFSGPLKTRRDFYQGLRAFQDIGFYPKYFRGPYGSYNLYLYYLLKKEKMNIIQWDDLLGDWEEYEPGILADKLKNKAINHHLLVLHDGTEGTAGEEAKYQMIKELQSFLKGKNGNGE